MNVQQFYQSLAGANSALVRFSCPRAKSFPSIFTSLNWGVSTRTSSTAAELSDMHHHWTV